jgi:hypothetical protein
VPQKSGVHQVRYFFLFFRFSKLLFTFITYLHVIVNNFGFSFYYSRKPSNLPLFAMPQQAFSAASIQNTAQSIEEFFKRILQVTTNSSIDSA